jgi:hypothetical protein
MGFRRHPGLNRRVLVALHSGNAVSGVLTKVTGPLLIVQGATIHEPNAAPAEADGQVVVDRDNVDYVQIVGGR